jgi:hypothetical protein
MRNPFTLLWSKLFPQVEPWVKTLADLLRRAPADFEPSTVGPGLYLLTRKDDPHLIEILLSAEAETLAVFSQGQELPLNRREMDEMFEAMDDWFDSAHGTTFFLLAIAPKGNE